MTAAWSKEELHRIVETDDLPDTVGPGPGQDLVDVEAVGVNSIDVYQLHGPRDVRFEEREGPGIAEPDQGAAPAVKRAFHILALTLAAMIASPSADATGGAQRSARPTADQKVTTMKIRMNVEGRSIAATLADNDTARDFASLLPLELTLTDYAATEKISDLPRRLSTEAAPPGARAPARGR